MYVFWGYSYWQKICHIEHMRFFVLGCSFPPRSYHRDHIQFFLQYSFETSEMHNNKLSWFLSTKLTFDLLFSLQINLSSVVNASHSNHPPPPCYGFYSIYCFKWFLFICIVFYLMYSMYFYVSVHLLCSIHCIICIGFYELSHVFYYMHCTPCFIL